MTLSLSLRRLNFVLRFPQIVLQPLAIRVKLLENLLQVLHSADVALQSGYQALLDVDQGHLDFFQVGHFAICHLFESFLLILEALVFLLLKIDISRARQRQQIPILARILFIARRLQLCDLLLYLLELLVDIDALIADFVSHGLRLQFVDLRLRQYRIMYLLADIEAVHDDQGVLADELDGLLEYLDVGVVAVEVVEEV